MDEGKDPQKDPSSESLAFEPYADTYLRELIAFTEICRETSVKARRVIEDWFAANKPYLSSEDLKDLGTFLDDFARAIIRHQIEAEPVTIKTSRHEVSVISEVLLMDLIFRGIPDRSKLVNRASLITAVSAFEVLFGRLVRIVCDYNPSAIARSEYTFTLEELSQYGSIEEARQELVTRKVEALLMESVDNWDKWLDRTVKVTFADTIADWTKVREIFARRNILVHANGKVTKRYLQDLKRAGIDTSDVVLDEQVDLSTTYIEDALERLAALGILLTFRVWVRLNKSDVDEAASWLVNRQEVLIRCEMWTAVYLISDQFSSVKCRRDISLNAQINGWLARKHLTGVESIKKDVSEWDVTGLLPSYSMIKKLLLNDFAGVESMLNQELESRRLIQFQVFTEPLFKEFHEWKKGNEEGQEEGNQPNDTEAQLADTPAQLGFTPEPAEAVDDSPDDRNEGDSTPSPTEGPPELGGAPADTSP